jgi:hypothetical protein
MAAYREQMVEIALGPKGAFENGSIGALTRRVATDLVVSAVRLRGDQWKPPKEPKTPQVAEFLRKAKEWQRQLDTGEICTPADIARREGVTRARVTQVMGMLRLTPEIQEQILSMPVCKGRALISERRIRTIEAIADPRGQLREFQKITL